MVRLKAEQFFGKAVRILIFKTNASAARDLHTLGSVFKEFHQVQKWTLDLEDIDKILRVEVPKTANLLANDVETAMNQAGFRCEELQDEQIAA